MAPVDPSARIRVPASELGWRHGFQARIPSSSIARFTALASIASMHAPRETQVRSLRPQRLTQAIVRLKNTR